MLDYTTTQDDKWASTLIIAWERMHRQFFDFCFILSIPNSYFQKQECRRRDINNTPWTVSFALENPLKG